MTTVNRGFADWATSFSGYCEGDLGAHLWICGLEPSSGNVDRLGLDASSQPRLVETVGGVLDRPAVMNVGRHETFPFGKKMLRLARAVLRRRLGEGELGATDLLKLNLFPLTAPDMKTWSEQGRESSGFSDKSAYQEWCRKYRFPKFSRLVAERRPAVIVGTGLGYADDYLLAFAGPMASGEQLLVQVHAPTVVVRGGVSVQVKQFDIVHPEGGRTRLFIVPFLSFRQGCLNSPELLDAVGEHVGERTWA